MSHCTQCGQMPCYEHERKTLGHEEASVEFAATIRTLRADLAAAKAELEALRETNDELDTTCSSMVSARDLTIRDFRAALESSEIRHRVERAATRHWATTVDELRAALAAAEAHVAQLQVDMACMIEGGDDLHAALAAAEVKVWDAYEQAAKVCDDYGREGDRLSQEYACETADELASRIRALAASPPVAQEPLVQDANDECPGAEIRFVGEYHQGWCLTKRERGGPGKCNCKPVADTPREKAQHPHLIDGQFQSDKYPTTPRGKVPLSVKDPTAQDLLWTYAQRRRAVDSEFATDLEIALANAGYVPDFVVAAVVSELACTCAAIQAADHARHFRGCPRRKPLEWRHAPWCSKAKNPLHACDSPAECARLNPPADKQTTATVLGVGAPGCQCMLGGYSDECPLHGPSADEAGKKEKT